MDQPVSERRQEPRITAKERVVVTELGPNGKAHVGLIVEVSGKSLTLKLVTAIAHGTPVQLEAENMLMLGEIVRCEPADDGFRPRWRCVTP